MALEQNFANALFTEANKANEQLQEELEAEMELEVFEAGTFTEDSDENTSEKNTSSTQSQEELPALIGEDADLLVWDADSQTFVPVDDEAARILQEKGENLSVELVAPGSAVGQKLAWVNGGLRPSSRSESQGDNRKDEPPHHSSMAQGQPLNDGPAGEVLEQLFTKALGMTDRTLRTGGSLVADATRNTITGCKDLVDKWKQDRQSLTDSIKSNTSEQIDQRQSEAESTKSHDLEALNDEDEVESSVAGINPEAVQSNAEAMREDSRQFKKEVEKRRDQFKGSVNKSLETIFQAMGYGDPMKEKAVSLEDFDAQLKSLPERKQEKVKRSIEAIMTDSEDFRAYIEEKADSPEAGKVDVEDQEAFAQLVSDIKDDPIKEVDKKYRDMLDKIGAGGASLKDKLGGVFKSLGDVVNRVAERIAMIKSNIANAVSMNQGSIQQQSERPG